MTDVTVKTAWVLGSLRTRILNSIQTGFGFLAVDEVPSLPTFLDAPVPPPTGPPSMPSV